MKLKKGDNMKLKQLKELIDRFIEDDPEAEDKTLVIKTEPKPGVIHCSIPHVGVKTVHTGFDWNKPFVFVVPSEPLKAKSVDLRLRGKVLELYEPIDPDKAQIVEGAQMLDGQWYAPIHGCDTLEHILDIIQ